MDVYNIESIPVLVEAFNGLSVKQIAAGYDHAAAVTEDGRLYMWGAKIWIEPHEMTAVNDHKVVQVACGRRQGLHLRQGELELPGPRRPQEPAAAGPDPGSGRRQHHLVRRLRLAGSRSQRSLTHWRPLVHCRVSCGDYHMGAIATPHAEAADKDFSFRE